jgi:hypothetical protein
LARRADALGPNVSGFGGVEISPLEIRGYRLLARYRGKPAVEEHMKRQYFEAVVEGVFDLIKGFVLGFLEGQGIPSGALFAREHHVKGDTELRHVFRLLTGQEDQVRVLVDGDVCRSLKEAIANVEEILPIKLVAVKEIASAHFSFTYEAFSKQMGDELRGLFTNPPEGVSVSDYVVEEKVDPEGKGIEAYAPLHDYEVKARGRITGPVRPVVDFYDRLELHPLVSPEEIVLEYS